MLRGYLETGASPLMEEGYRVPAGVTGVRAELVQEAGALSEALTRPEACVQMGDLLFVPETGGSLDPSNRSLVPLEARYEQIVRVFEETASSR